MERVELSLAWTSDQTAVKLPYSHLCHKVRHSIICVHGATEKKINHSDIYINVCLQEIQNNLSAGISWTDEYQKMSAAAAGRMTLK